MISFADEPQNADEDKIYCARRHKAVDRKACLLEQRAARKELENDELDEPYKQDYYANRLERCQVFSEPEDIIDCASRVREGKTYGSVEAGGTITIHRAPAPPKKPRH